MKPRTAGIQYKAIEALSANPNYNATFFTNWSNIMRVSYAYFSFFNPTYVF